MYGPGTRSVLRPTKIAVADDDDNDYEDDDKGETERNYAVDYILREKRKRIKERKTPK